MKHLWIILLASIMLAPAHLPAQPAQSWDTDIPGIQQIMIQYGDQLNLTDDQKSELINLSIDQMQRQRVRPDRRQRPALRSQRHLERERGERPQRREHRERETDEGEERIGRNERGDREERGAWSERRPRDYRGERGDRSHSSEALRVGILQNVYEVLTDEQAETLKSKLAARAEMMHEYRALRNEKLIGRAGIEGDSATRVKEILDWQSEARTALGIHRIENPGEMDRERMQEAFQSMREGHREMREILSAAEFEKLQRLISPRTPRQYAQFRRSAFRSR